MFRGNILKIFRWIRQGIFATLLLVSIPVRASVLFESASADALSDSSGISVGGGSSQIFGAAFELNASARVSAIGGLFFAQGDPFPDDIFGALVRLTSIDALPTGNPFSIGEVVGNVVFDVGTTAPQDVVVPLDVVLDQGAYALVFGSGQYGTVGVATLPPTGQVFAANYLVWNTDGGQWFGGDGYGRVFVIGTSVPEPQSAMLLLVGGVVLGWARRRRTIAH